MHLTGAIHGVLTVLLVILCETTANTPVNNCVSDYEDFENKTFSNKENRYKLYEVFYPPNRHLPYAVELTYQATLLNGTEINITSSDDFCDIVRWRWIASPVFLFVEPDILDALVLHTLNYFRAWTTPSVILHVPYPCTNNTVTFLARMTSLVHEYSLGKQGSKTPSGNVASECTGGKQVAHIPTLSYKSIRNSVMIIHVAIRSGLLCVALLAILWYVVALRGHLKERVKLSYTYSYNHYGFWWGVTILVLIILPLMLDNFLSMVIENYHEYFTTANIKFFLFPTALLALCFLSGIPISIYFACKTDPPAVPYILMIPVAVLLCCCSTKRAKSLVFGMALWINLVTLTSIALHSVLILLTVMAEPFAVITNTLILLLLLYCITNIFALAFTIFAYIFTRKHQRPQGEGTTMLRATILIFLLVVVCCICLCIGVIGYLVNADTKQGSFVSLASSALVPLILGLITFGLKRLISKWLDKAPNSNPSVGEPSEELIPLE